MAKAKKSPAKPKEDTKAKARDLALAAIDSKFGKGSAMMLDSKDAPKTDVPIVSTGSLHVDKALGVGGLARGRIVEIYGPESSGKTTLALHVMAEAQKLGGAVAFIDAEHALDKNYAKNLGIDTFNVVISQPESGEQALEITETLVKSGGYDVIVVDSVAALVPQAELDGEMGDSHMGLQARLMSQAMRKLSGATSKSKCIVIFINQIREKIGVVFGNPETTTGGRALKFYASVRMDIRRVGAYPKGSKGADILGNATKVKIVKNKLAPPFREAFFVLRFGHGIDTELEMGDLGLQYGILNKSGTWYSFGEERIGQGAENVRKTLLADNNFYNDIRKAIKEHKQ